MLCCTTRFSPSVLRTHPPAAKTASHPQPTIESFSRNCPWLKGETSPKNNPTHKSPPVANKWSTYWHKGLAHSPQSETILKGSPSSRAPQDELRSLSKYTTAPELPLPSSSFCWPLTNVEGAQLNFLHTNLEATCETQYTLKS